MKTTLYYLCLGLLCSAPLVGCESAKEQMGLQKQTPDEFQVVKRAPLEIPANFQLPPPRPGAPRPQERAADTEAAIAVFGTDPASATPKQDGLTSGESALLSMAGAHQSNSNIRSLVDTETKALHDRNKPVAEKLLNIGGDRNQASATVVDAPAEAERLKRNAAEGKAVTEGETPSIEE